MPRLLGVDIPNDKRIDVALQYLYGIGAYRAAQICRETNLDPATRAKNLKDDELVRIANFVEENYNDDNWVDGRSGPVEGTLRRRIQANVTRLKKIQSYRGIRHIRGLPVRGQRTRTNARTRKGRKRTVPVKVSVKSMK